MADDEYAQSAEFFDLVIAPYWDSIRPVLRELLLTAQDGPIVDVGAGSGRGIEVITTALPKAEIFAVEPSPGLRSALMCRISSGDRLRKNVTVLPDRLLSARLPERFSAVVAMNVLGHFTESERHETWRLLSQRLIPGGRAIVNIQQPDEPTVVSETVMGSAHVGRRRYEIRASAEPAGKDSLTWHMTYRTEQDGEIADERHGHYLWHVVTADRMRDELEHYGLQLSQARPAELGMYVISS